MVGKFTFFSIIQLDKLEFGKWVRTAMDKGKIIILNGVSSSGKTTLAKAIQNTLDELYVRLSIDDFISMMPGEMVESELGNAVYTSQTILLQTIKTLSDAGTNVIVDNIMLTYFETLKQYVECLHDYPVLLVKVVCPAHELRRRETERGDRAVGQGERQINDLEPQDYYDISIDTFANTTEECVSLIAKKLTTPNSISSLKQLWVLKSEK